MKVLITGGSRGIGKSISELFIHNGWETICPTRKEMDLSDPTSVWKFISDHDQRLPGGYGFDAIINNAGINVIGDVGSVERLDYHRMFEVNVHSPFRLIDGFIPLMKSRNFGRIVNISSIFGTVVSKPKRVVYSMTKSALLGMTKAMAVELALYNIMVNCISPGYIDTDLTHQNNTPDQITEIESSIPTGKLGQPIDVARTALFLCDPKNTYITGQNIIVDGGISIC